MKQTYLTTKELSSLIKYDEKTIRDHLKDSVLLHGRHYFYPFGGRKILYIWENIQEDMFQQAEKIAQIAIPMANGGICNAY